VNFNQNKNERRFKMEGIFIGTLILWGLTAILVKPLTIYCVSRRMAAEGVTATAPEEQTVEVKQYWSRVATQYYILWDVVVLGIAGFIGGLLGFWFIGISLEAKGWPGMIAFIAASFMGIAAKGA
jgi:ABC-type long-subunit fatty acid transport system fused permease/ATPase subunit